MRQISSRQREEPIRGRPDDPSNASQAYAPDAPPRSPLGSEHPSAPRDFTAQVMARLAAPAPKPDPRTLRARARARRARAFGRVYIGLLLMAVVAVLALAFTAPWTLVSLVVGLVGGVVFALAGAADIARATGGFINGVGVIYAVMMALLAPILLFLLVRRIKHQRVSIK